MYSRRQFLRNSTATLAGLALSDSLLANLKLHDARVGIQLFTIPGVVSKDFRGTMEKLANIGYREIEMFGPYAFSAAETIESWKQLSGMLGITQNALYGYTPAGVKALFAELGLSCPSVHLDLTTLRKNLDNAMENLAALGTKYVAIPAISNPADRSDFVKLADELSGYGQRMAAYGLTLVYHNHGYEHAPDKDGKVLMDTLLTQTDAKNLQFELDIFWMTAGGASPVEYLNKYPGRFKLMHVKNASEPVRFSGDGGSPDQWMPLFGKMADPGEGVFDIPAIVAAGKKAGVEHFYLERDMTPDPDRTLQGSFHYLHKVL